MLETLISIVILGLIVVGSFYSYSMFHQRIHSQRQHRIVLGVLQGGMEKTISSLLDPKYLEDPNTLADPHKRSMKEEDLIEKFRKEIDKIFYNNINIDSNIVFIEPNILLHYNKKNNMIGIKIRVDLNGLPIPLYTEIHR